jgi:BirA family biotin operon repressor/biotin-[acetyl-CoA-carboxylase] ligase
MDLPLSRQIAPNLRFVAETGSTNTDLVADASNSSDFQVLVAGFQTAGKGRSGRDWIAPQGSSLFVSVLLRPDGVEAKHFSWLPLLTGLAMTKTVSALLPGKAVSLKWPNDVLVQDCKISGVLSELLADLTAVVVGAGLNVLQSKSELPIETATSLKIEGSAQYSLDQILATYLQNLKDLYTAWVVVGGDAVRSGLRQEVMSSCSTLGVSGSYRAGNKKVRAILPGEQELIGDAVGIDDTGRLIVQPIGEKEVVAVAAGDIVHLRHN